MIVRIAFIAIVAVGCLYAVYFETYAQSGTIPRIEPQNALCGSEGKRVQVLYVQLASKPNRHGLMRQMIADALWTGDRIFDASAHRTNGHRHVRWSMTDNCQIDVRQVQVLNLQSGYLIEELEAQGYNREDRKYLLLVDAFSIGWSCGRGNTTPDDQPGSNNANNGAGFIFLYLGCWNGFSVAHELTHSFGGVQLTAPHSSGGWHCTDGRDVMCYSDPPFYPAMVVRCEGKGDGYLLDCNNDDYFHTSPEAGSYLAMHWNIADSAYLTSDEWRTYAPMVMQ